MRCRPARALDLGQRIHAVAGARYATGVMGSPRQETTMEFHVRASRPLPPLPVIEDALLAYDPSAVVDIDPGAGLRVNAAIDADGLMALLNEVGGAVRPGEVEQRPSVCCGGCGG